MAVVEKPIDDKIKLSSVNEYPEYDPKIKHTIWVDVNLSAPIFEEDDNKRALVDIVAVIDRSGSMSGEKLKLVKTTLEFVVSQLTAKDRLCLVVYDDKVDLVFPLTFVSSENKTDIMGKIQSVQTKGSTNLCGGLLKGMQIVMERAGAKADVASVLLLTDGMANAGICDKEGILKAMKTPFATHITSQPAMQNFQWSSQNASAQMQPQMLQETPMDTSEDLPVVSESSKKFDGTVYTFGFGADHNAELLKEISDAKNGVYYFIDTAEKVPESFANCLGGLLSTVGQNITLKVEMKNDAVIKEVTAKNTAKYNETKTEAVVALGDLQSEEQRDVLLEIEIPISDEATSNKHYASFTLNYFNVITAAIHNDQCKLLVDRTNTGKPKVTNPLLEKQKLRVETVSVIKEAQSRAKQGKFNEGKELLSACKSKVTAANVNEDDAYTAMIGDIDDCLEGVKDQTAYSGFGQQRMYNAMQSNMIQRQNWSAPDAPAKAIGYTTGAKSKMMQMAPK